MVEIGGKPVIWHIMNLYGSYGFDEFIIALGYKAEIIKEYFLHFYALNNHISLDFATGKTTIHAGSQPKWKVHLIDTGLDTETGGRLKRLEGWLEEDEPFMFTYGDGLADIDLRDLLEFHERHGKLATVTAVRPPARFGRMTLQGDRVVEFHEKPEGSEGWINGGFFVLNKKVLDYIEGDETRWEQDPVQRLARAGKVVAYRHTGFWSCMDTLREKNMLEDLWRTGNAPWQVWDTKMEVAVSLGTAMSS
jgi:glucose-1-phosphate cytidylyltransferase